MKYAIISDIHGNDPALKAVLEDAQKCGVDEYIFLGDYISDLPYANEVTEAIRNTKRSHIIKGNREGYLINLSKEDQSNWIYEQFGVMYFNYNELTKDNREYLMNLPDEKILHTFDGKQQIQMLHASSKLFHLTQSHKVSCVDFKERMEAKLFTHEEYLTYIKDLFSNDLDALAELNNNPSDVILFGHSHVQWYAEVGHKLLINAGSCGLPLDFNKDAAYTIADYGKGKWEVQERRVAYDIDSTIRFAKQSDMYNMAKVWCDIVFDTLLTGQEIVSFFFEHVEQIAMKRNDLNRPYTNETWRMAAESWGY